MGLLSSFIDHCHDVNQESLLREARFSYSLEDKNKIVRKIDKEHIWQLYKIWDNDEDGIMAIVYNYGYNREIWSDILKRKNLKPKLREQVAYRCNDEHTLLWCYIREEPGSIRIAIESSWRCNLRYISSITSSPKYQKYFDDYVAETREKIINQFTCVQVLGLPNFTIHHVVDKFNIKQKIVSFCKFEISYIDLCKCVEDGQRSYRQESFTNLMLNKK